MGWIRRLWTTVHRGLFRHAQADQDLDDELRFHLAQETQLLVDRGASPEDARRAARRAFGSLTLARETVRAVWVWPDYAGYQKKTDRQIPLFVLTPVS